MKCKIKLRDNIKMDHDLPRVSHCRFNKLEPIYLKSSKNGFNRVVTVAWNFDTESKVLTYAATVFKKVRSNEIWVKKMHREEALERFEKSPIRIQFLDCEPKYLNKFAIDWFIARKLVFNFGCWADNQEHLQGEVRVPFGFNEKYDEYHQVRLINHMENQRKRDHYKTEDDGGCYLVGWGLVCTGLVGISLIMTL